ncbi:MAG TPA: hypothetical protein VI703_06890 [Anaerolineales bacterium]|nr:hypothetical protein [Anaerolineales bacterium]
MATKRYVWKDKSAIKVKPEVAAAELAEIKEEHGFVNAHLVVESSRSSKSPLHQHFEWDDRKAAEMYRENQASYLIRMLVTVELDEQGAETIEYRTFVSVTDEDDDGLHHLYLPTEEALQDVRYRGGILAQALRELESWKKRYQNLQELAAVFAAARKVQKKLELVANSIGK